MVGVVGGMGFGGLGLGLMGFVVVVGRCSEFGRERGFREVRGWLFIFSLGMTGGSERV